MNKKNKLKSLIIGKGEIGKSLYNILKKVHDVDIKDIEPLEGKYDIIHICFPFSKNFISQVNEYKKIYNPTYTIIHSTVPVGTSRICGAFNSPVRGVHPKLELSLETFVKYLSPKSPELAKYFKEAGITIVQIESTDDTEAMKLWCTTYYGWNIIFEKICHKWCEMKGVNYDIVYTESNKTYNEGYTKLGMEHVVRPVLDHADGDIGGHCVIPNLELFNSPVNIFIRNFNEQFRQFKESKMHEMPEDAPKVHERIDWRHRN